jgi:hypothetical protein
MESLTMPADCSSSASATDALKVDLDELALLAAGYPAFQFWRETLPDRSWHIARTNDLQVHPTAVITDDLAELQAALRAGKVRP